MRRHRILDATFKALEKQGAKIKESERKELIAEVQGEPIEFGVREKQMQVRRPLTKDEERWKSYRDKGYVRELQLTGKFVFTIKTYLPGQLKREWLESDQAPMETLLSDIVATFIAAGPLLVAKRLEREEERRQWELAEQRRRDEEARRKREHNQWRHLVGLAAKRREAQLAREFLAEMKGRTSDPEHVIGGRTVQDWIQNLESWADDFDPLNHSVEQILTAISAITEWSQAK